MDYDGRCNAMMDIFEIYSVLLGYVRVCMLA